MVVARLGCSVSSGSHTSKLGEPFGFTVSKIFIMLNNLRSPQCNRVFSYQTDYVETSRTGETNAGMRIDDVDDRGTFPHIRSVYLHKRIKVSDTTVQIKNGDGPPE